jgi:hypothetical protein
MASFDRAQRRVIALLALASAFDGVSQGILLLQESIARKALEASNFQITMIGVITSGTMLLSFFVSYFFAGRNKKWLVAAGYLGGRAVFALSFLITKASVFLVFVLLFQGLFAIQVPVMNAFLQRRLGARVGQGFGIVRTVLILFTMLTSLVVGRILDAGPARYVALLSLIALSGLCTYAIFFGIEAGSEYQPAPRPRLSGLFGSLARIARDRAFMDFELVFMVYGFAFMIILPAVPVFLLRDLKLGYAEMALAQGVFAQLAILILTPFAGRIFDRVSLWAIGAFSFGVLLLYPACFLASYLSGSKALAYLGYSFSSLGLAGIGVLWNLGSASFARGEGEAFFYQGFHVSLTGIRGILGPFLGLLILTVAGVQYNFALATLLFAVASLMSLSRARRATGPAA